MYNRGGSNMNHRAAPAAGAVRGNGAAAASSSADVMESQNEAMLTNLQSKISSLKNITIAIGEEVKEQNKALEQMQNGMGATDNLLSSTLVKMKVMYSSHGSMSIVYLAGFCVLTFLVMYFLVRWGRA